MTTSKPLFKVICLKNAGALVKSETYEVFETANMLGKECYQIMFSPEGSRFSRVMWYEKAFFTTLAEWREKQINSILDI